MFFFTIRRILASVLVLVASSFLVFALCAASFDPLAQYFSRNPRPPEAFFDQLREKLGLNDNFFVRYWHWLSGAVHGDFGLTVNGTPVADQLPGRLLVTGRMIIAATVIAIVLAIIVGVIGAVRQYKPSDYTFTFIAYILIALPTFWFAALLKEFVAGGVNDLFGSQVLYTSARRRLACRCTPAAGSCGRTGWGTSCCRRSAWRCSPSPRGAGSSAPPCWTCSARTTCGLARRASPTAEPWSSTASATP